MTKAVAWLLIVSLIIGSPLPAGAEQVSSGTGTQVIQESMTIEQASAPQTIPPEMQLQAAAFEQQPPPPDASVAEPVKAVYDAYFRLPVSDQLSADELAYYAGQLEAGTPLATVQRAIRTSLAARKKEISKVYGGFGLKAPVGEPLAGKVFAAFAGSVRNQVLEENRGTIEANLAGAYSKALRVTGLHIPADLIAGRMAQIETGTGWSVVAKEISKDVSSRKSAVTAVHSSLGLKKPAKETVAAHAIETYSIGAGGLRQRLFAENKAALRTNIETAYSKALGAVGFSVPPEAVDTRLSELETGTAWAAVHKAIKTDISTRKATVKDLYKQFGVRATAQQLAAGCVISYSLEGQALRDALFEGVAGYLKAQLESAAAKELGITGLGIVIPAEEINPYFDQIASGAKTLAAAKKELADGLKTRESAVTAVYTALGIPAPAAAVVAQKVLARTDTSTLHRQTVTENEPLLRSKINASYSSFLKTTVSVGEAEMLANLDYLLLGNSLGGLTTSSNASLGARSASVKQVYSELEITPSAAQVAANTLLLYDPVTLSTLRPQMVQQHQAQLSAALQTAANGVLGTAFSLSADEMTALVRALHTQPLASVRSSLLGSLAARKQAVLQIYADLQLAAPAASAVATAVVSLYSPSPAGATEKVATLREQVIAHNEAALREAVQDVFQSLGKNIPASGETVGLFVEQLETMPLSAVKSAIQSQIATIRFTPAEMLAVSLTQIYQEILGRDPSDAELEAESADPSQTTADLRAKVAAGGEAAQRIHGLYERVLTRSPASAEITSMQAGLAGGQTFAQAAAALVQSQEVTAKISGVYGRVLGQAPTAAQLAARRDELTAGASFLDMVAGLIASPEARTVLRQTFLGMANTDALPEEEAQIRERMAWEEEKAARGYADLSHYTGIRRAAAEHQTVQDGLWMIVNTLLDGQADSSTVQGWTDQLANGLSWDALMSQVRSSPAAQNTAANVNGQYGRIDDFELEPASSELYDNPLTAAFVGGALWQSVPQLAAPTLTRGQLGAAAAAAGGPAAASSWRQFITAANPWIAWNRGNFFELGINVTPMYEYNASARRDQIAAGYIQGLNQMTTLLENGQVGLMAGLKWVAQYTVNLRELFSPPSGIDPNIHYPVRPNQVTELRNAYQRLGNVLVDVGWTEELGPNAVFSATTQAQLNGILGPAAAGLPAVLRDKLYDSIFKKTLVVRGRVQNAPRSELLMSGLDQALQAYNGYNSGALVDLQAFLSMDTAYNRPYANNAARRMYNELNSEAATLIQLATVLGANAPDLWGAEAVLEAVDGFIDGLGYAGIVATAPRVIVGVVDGWGSGIGVGGSSHGAVVVEHLQKSYFDRTGEALDFRNILELDTFHADVDHVERTLRLIRTGLAKVINTSWVSMTRLAETADLKLYENLVRWAESKGMIWIGGAGNDFWTMHDRRWTEDGRMESRFYAGTPGEDLNIQAPARFGISVTTKEGNRGVFKNSALADLGVESRRLRDAGTSFAAPTVTGEVVAMLEVMPNLDKAGIVGVLRNMGYAPPATSAGSARLLVESEYMAALGYQPDPAALSNWVAAIEEDWWLEDLRNTVQAEAVRQGDIVDSEFNRMLARNATAAERKTGITQLGAADNQTGLSSWFWVNYTGEVTARLNGVYTSFLGVTANPVTAAEMNFYRDRVRNDSLAAAQWEIESSLSHRKGVVEEVHVAALELAADPASIPSATVTSGIASLFSLSETSYQSGIVDANLSVLIPALQQIYRDRFGNGDPSYPVDPATIDAWLNYLKFFRGSLTDIRNGVI